jgi:hypothetical protein
VLDQFVIATRTIVIGRYTVKRILRLKQLFLPNGGGTSGVGPGSRSHPHLHRLNAWVPLQTDLVHGRAGNLSLLRGYSPGMKQAARRRFVRALFAAVLTGGIAAGIVGAQTAPTAAGTIRVVPDPAMALTDWNALLHVLQLRVVGGPDSMGAYTVAPMGGPSKMQLALRQLRAIRGVKLAEPITHTP